MEEASRLSIYCEQFANTLSPSSGEDVSEESNDAVSRFGSIGLSLGSSSPPKALEFWKCAPSRIREVYGGVFCSENAFRRASSACALLITDCKDLDVTAGWLKLRFLLWSCLLNPFTSSDVIKEFPDIALSLVVEFMDSPRNVDGLVLEHLTLLWRLRRDVRLQRKVRNSLCMLLETEDVTSVTKCDLDSSVDPTGSWHTYKLRLLRGLSDLLKFPYHSNNTDWDSSACTLPDSANETLTPSEISGDQCYAFEDLHIIINNLQIPTFHCPNLVHIGNRVSYLRSSNVVSNDSFVELDYSSEVLASMLCHVDVSVGSVVSGESCKEFYIYELANRVGISHELISRIYTDEGTDVKTLIGQWICTEKVGEFKFNYGILTTAMRNGRWLIFDETLSESIGCLLYSVCQQGCVTIPELNETVEASSNFHFFVTTKNATTLCGSLKHLPRTHIPTLSESDCVDILSSRYATLRPISKTVVSAFFALRSKLSEHRGFNMSDLFKISHRLDTSGTTFDGYLSSSTKGVILESFYCVLLAGTSCEESRVSLLGDIAEHIGVSRISSYDMLPINQIRGHENTRVHLKVLHQLMSCYLCNEPVLLVGETGSGKTAIVQHFAKLTGHALKVYVFSEQSEAEDLIGSFFPDNIADVSTLLFNRALVVFLRCCVVDDSLLCFLDHLVELFRKGLYPKLLRIISTSLGQLLSSNIGDLEGEIAALRSECNIRCGGEVSVKLSIPLSYLQQPMDSILRNTMPIYEQYKDVMKPSGPNLQFKFEEGLLIQAMREGSWILLDEINLAPSDLLQRFVGILSKTVNRFELYECGNRVIDIHENFRVFACMNPPTIRKGDFVTFTSGKKELPPSFRGHMTEIFVDAIDTIEDISIVVASYVDQDDRSIPCDEICHFYLRVLEMCRLGELEDGSFKSPTFTLRNLVRTIRYMQCVMKRCHRAVKDGREAFADAALSCFASSLGPISFSKVASLLPSTKPRCSAAFEESVDYVKVEGYWIRRGSEPVHRQEHFIVTPNIQKNLRRISRVLSGLRVPVLLEGPTACGKTSLVQYLSALTGHRCIRINNHEHTDLSEYLGQFVFDSVSSRLRFNYGPIVTAMREGHWVILDELNLAPSQILEALNRILDDNREVYVPETGETIKSHPEFMIFATQNPANSIYGGRKQLSKAFCNRFVQLYIDGLDTSDLQQVLHQRCHIPLSRAEKIVSTFQSIQSCPMNSMAFERQSVLITLRDLIKWANRVRVDDEGLAYYGWCVIAEKLRNPAEQEVVREVIERCCLLSKPGKPKHLSIDFASDLSLCKFLQSSGLSKSDLCTREHYLWLEGTTTRLVALLLRALENSEPVLLVGDTGIGKTTVCQLLAKLQGTRLNILNLSKNSEASDFIGSFRPIRGLKCFHANVEMLIDYFEDDVRCVELVEFLREVMTLPLAKVDHTKFLEILELVSVLLDSDIASDGDHHCKRQKMKSMDPVHMRTVINHMAKSFSNALFEWVDGPLTRSMELGEWFLADEISLADDAVLEKMNSVLELPSTLTIPEAGGDTLRVLRANPKFRFLATMNPSGDHGKRELSPALLNRFTVIYIPTPDFNNFETVRSILEHYSQGQPDWVAHSMVDVICLYNERCPHQKLTLRDIIKWAEFVSTASPLDSFLHGAHVVFLDNVVTGFSGISLGEVLDIVLHHHPDVDVAGTLENFDNNNWVHSKLQRLSLHPVGSIQSYNLRSKNCLQMVGKILRALEVNRPILLEGEPGVGKSASISALASIHGIKLLRVNLSEHTDIMDLFGSDIPAVVDGSWKFIWHNGPVLEAAVNGYWIVLDELNLASQQVLEGLNALLDHRRETFIPELDRFIKCHENFRLFASQNSAVDGGGRKHLPKSFLNRFTKIYCQPLEEQDYNEILTHLYPALPASTVSRIVSVLLDIKRIHCDRVWEWNLRDCIRFCDAISRGIPSENFDDALRFVFMSRLDSSNQWDSMLRTLVGDDFATRVSRMMPFTWHPVPHAKDRMDVDNPVRQDTTRIIMSPEVTCTTRSPPKPWSDKPIWMQSQDAVHNTLCMAACLNFPVLLVGPDSSGKQSVIKCVASRCGQPLVELTMLPCFDTNDLLGGFEQVGGNNDSGSSPGSFRWVDSPLVSSIESGSWLLLSRIHHANPAILDRLNSLLEVGGSLTLNESGDCNRVVKPHPNFRIFMTANSKHVGRLSRAFRNRCMEVSMCFPSALRQALNENPKCKFMDDLHYQIGTCLGVKLEDESIDQPHEVEFKCSTLIDGARLVRSIRNYTWTDSLAMSLCNCVLGWYMSEYASGAYSHCDWLFLKSWCMLDQPLEMSSREVSRLFPPEFQEIAMRILERCLDWCFHNITSTSCGALNLVINFLHRCTVFDDRLQRDIVAAGFAQGKIDPDSVVWFMFRSSVGDYEKRYHMLCKFYELGIPRHLLELLFNYCLSFNRDTYEMQTLFSMFAFDSMKFLNKVGAPQFSMELFEHLVNMVTGGDSIMAVLSKLQFISYLLSHKDNDAPVTVEYISHKVFAEFLDIMDKQLNHRYPSMRKSIEKQDVEFTDYSTAFIGNRICYDVELALELHCNGLGSMIPSQRNLLVHSEANVTASNILKFVDGYMGDLGSTVESCGTMRPEAALRIRHVETPNPALTKFVHDRLRFLCCWICHQFLVGDMLQTSLRKVYEYAMELLKLHVDVQNDLPSSSICVLVSILVSLRRLMDGCDSYGCVYQIMLDTWSLHNTLPADIQLDPLSYMVNLMNGNELGMGGASASEPIPQLNALDNITSVMLFWENVSKDNGLPSLRANLRRIESLRQMLSDNIPIPQWSGLFTTLTLVSPIVSKVLGTDTQSFDVNLRKLYNAITRDETPCIGMFDERTANATTDGKFRKEVVPTGTGIIYGLATRTLQLLSKVASSPIESRLTYVSDIWHVCGLILMLSIPNVGMVVDDVRKELDCEHRRDLRENMERRLEKHVTLDTLSDGECGISYNFLTTHISALTDGDEKRVPSLRSYKPEDNSGESFGSTDTVALLCNLKCDVDKFCEESLKLGNDFVVRCDLQCLMNFRRYLLRQYIIIPEVLRPLLVGLDCLSFSLVGCRAGSCRVVSTIPRTVQFTRVGQRCLQFPFNILKRASQGDLISLSARFYDSKGLYDVHCYVNCLLSSVRHDLLHPTSMESLKYAVLLLSGLASKLKTERSEGQEMRMSLLQSCIAMAQKSGEKGIHDLLPSQQEIVRAIIRDCGPMDEYESLDPEDDEPVEEVEQNRELERIAAVCRLLTTSLHNRTISDKYTDLNAEFMIEYAQVDKDERLPSEFASSNQTWTTRQMNSALCLAIACGADCTPIFQSGEGVLLSRRLMVASEEHFGYSTNAENAAYQSFYKTVDIGYCMKAWDIMERLGTSVHALLSQFERQQQLLDIESMLNSIAKVKLPTVTQVLLVTLLENLVARVHKWNAISHSGISIRGLSSEIETLILDLRHRELKGWYLAIDDRLDSFRESSYSYMVYFVEMCSSMYDATVPLSTRVHNCATEIVKFVMVAPMAHFDPVLAMLRTVVLLYRDTCIQTEIVMRSVLENIVWFLELWHPTVVSRIDSLKQEAHREVNELVKRINWSGSDYMSISTLIHKQKNQLSSVMRRFQEAIAQPWSTVYITSSVQWYTVVENAKDEKLSSTDKMVPDDTADARAECSLETDDFPLLECLRSNIEYIRANKKEISRVQITRITREVGKLLTDMGYNASSGHDSGDWISWLDLGISMRSNGCIDADNARDLILRTLHIICDLNESFRRDKDMFDFFSRNVDLNIFGYLVSMLRTAQSNIVDDVAEFERCSLSQYEHSIIGRQAVYRMDHTSFQQVISIVDDIYEGVLQATDLLLWDVCNVSSRIEQHPPKMESKGAHPLLTKVSDFRSWLESSEEFRAFNCLKGDTTTVVVSGIWLESMKTFCDDISNSGCSSSPVSPFFQTAAYHLESLVGTPKMITNLPEVKVTEFKSKDPVLPLACLYMAQLIDAIAHVEPPQDERTHESRDEWAAGTGLEDGTGAKNVSEGVEPEDGMFDNFKNESVAEPGEMSAENPSVDVDLEFDGEVFDVEGSRECSDIEEDDNPGHNEEFEDLQRKQLDAELVDAEPPLDDSGHSLDIDGGVSMDDTKDTADDSDHKVDPSGRENNYSSEVEQQQEIPDSQPQTTKEGGDKEPDDINDGDTKGDLEGLPEESGIDNEDQPNEPISDPTLDMKGQDLDGDDLMDTDEVVHGSEEDGTAVPDPQGNEETIEDHDGMDTDLPDSQTRARKDYEETPYGTDGNTASNIRSDEQNEVGGNSYEEDSFTGSLWGESSRSRGGMVSFLDMIQRLERPPETSGNTDLKLKNISNSMSEGHSKDAHEESMNNQLDETSNLEGLAASIEGSAAPNVDMMDMPSFGRRALEEDVPMKFSEEADPRSSTMEQKPSAATAMCDNDDTILSDINEESTGDMDTSAVLSGGTTAVGVSTVQPSELLSREGSSSTHKADDMVKASAMWRQYRDETSAISTTLCEQMRMILEPTLNSGLQGDYKTGKRISIRKLMAFIASNYQRDRIWLRRSKPSKRDYRVVLAIDNSRSMAVTSAGSLALKSFACIYQAMSVLEVGKLSVCKFGGNVPELLLEMDGDEDPCRVVAGMTFDEESRHSHETGLPELLKYVLRYLEHQDERRKIIIIISDGKFNKEKARPWIQAAINNQVVPLLVILDPLTSANKSILQMKHVREIDGCLKVETFLSNFPFPYYAVIQNLARLPNILSDLLRQWFALSNQR